MPSRSTARRATPGAAHPSRSLARARAEVSAGLAAARDDIEEALTVRAFAAANPTGAEPPGYVEGLREAIVAAASAVATLLFTT